MPKLHVREIERRQKQLTKRDRRQQRRAAKRKQSRVVVSVHMVGDDRRFCDLHLRG